MYNPGGRDVSHSILAVDWSYARYHITLVDSCSIFVDGGMHCSYTWNEICYNSGNTEHLNRVLVALLMFQTDYAVCITESTRFTSIPAHVC
jgi:hypothetical protein